MNTLYVAMKQLSHLQGYETENTKFDVVRF